LATAPLGRASLQLLPDSAFLRDLAQGPVPGQVEIVTVAGERDLLAPSRTTRIAGARHVEVPTNHAGLLVDPKVAETVAEILAESPVTT
jgi:hypothetical protein